MKGTIHKCLEEMVLEKHGQAVWQKCLLQAGFAKNRDFYPTEDVEEEGSLQLILDTAKTLEISLNELFDDFGEFWCCTYAPKRYSFWYVGVKNAKDFILRLDNIHSLVGKHFNNAQPPRFGYTWQDPSQTILRVEYVSSRNLIDLYISLAKGLGKYFQEEIQIQKLSAHEVELRFAY
ncbi:MAG: hypothetical protein HC913_18855 [Microscillaceae bacterium]|nr:hypothetical protein [Microscillaceae bacterium]